jgi:hypothetical protein
VSGADDDGEFSADDIVLTILRRVVALAPECLSIAGQVETEIRSRYGGKKVRIPKRGKYLTAEQREDLFRDAIAGMPTEEIVRKHKISRRTLFYAVKKGGRFGG